jgi:adenosylcobinamide kinase / adenosylcobinamide-phosphate guanylyltransferase
MDASEIKQLPMATNIVLITGGARSGKSRYAEQRARELGPRRLYIATAEAKDQEMCQRIDEHKRGRGNDWVTIEEPLALTETLLGRRHQTDCAVVDCLTLWLSNLLLAYEAKYAREKVEQFIEAARQLDFHLILVSNEVGWGVVPDNSLARQFRDLSGWANQRIATVANEVVLMITGVPMIVKKTTL